MRVLRFRTDLPWRGGDSRVKVEIGAVLTPAQQAVVEHALETAAVVEAGAGTGKTFTIVERVAALHERGICDADRILLLTFARKAAAELRARIARRLGDVTPTCSTFHAFAWSLLKDHAYEVGIAPETEVLEDVEARVEFKHAFDAFLDDGQAAPSGFPLRAFNRDEIRRELFLMDQQLKQRGVSIDEFEANALAAADAFERTPHRALRQRYQKPRGGKEWSIEAEISDQALVREIVWERERIRACADIFRRFAARLDARHALTYADILVRAEEALRAHPALRASLRRRYACCIVDEYQDTDLSQHRLLEALFGEQLGGVMVVGDTLQSIFSFRGARPENFALFLNRPTAVRYALAQNRRSHQEILDLAHASIVPVHTDAQRLQAERGSAGAQIVHSTTTWESGATYLPVEAAREREAEAVARRIALLLASGRQVDTGSGPEPISPKHIAILSRTKRNVQPVTEALISLHVPFKLVGGVGFYDAPEIRDTLAWIRLLANAFDSHAVARALQSSAIGAADATLARLARGVQDDETAFARRALIEELPAGDELAERAADAARRLRALLESLAPHAALPLSAALAAVIEAAGVARAAASSDDPRSTQALANLSKLEALARSFAQTLPGAQPADFVSFIDELENVDFDEREADVTSEEAVAISTIHAAKGLEWPFVFVLGVWPQLAHEPRIFVDLATDALLYAENPDGSRPFHYQSVKLRADAEGFVPRDAGKERSEELRLFYVALTRARDRLFVSGPRLYPSKENPAGKPHDYILRLDAGLLERGWLVDEPAPDVAASYASRTSQANARIATRPRSLPAKMRSEDASRLAIPLSFSRIARFERCPREAVYEMALGLPEIGRAKHGSARWSAEDAVDEPGAAAPPDALLNAGEYGQTLHKALELWASDLRDGRSSASAALYLDEALKLVRSPPSREQHDEALFALERIKTELGRWKPLQIEAPFTLDFGDEGDPLLVTGYLDLVATDADGKVCLVDYKSGDPFEDHALQLALYRMAAREVYGLPVERCLIGQVAGKNFSLDQIQPVDETELRDRIRAVRRGLAQREDRARPGKWCWNCSYRAAPCLDYQDNTPKRARPKPKA